MAVYKEEKTGTWRVIYRYTDWTGEKKQTQKRGFQTKREAQAWEREQLNKARADLDMTFKSFVEQYTADMQTRIKENTWAKQVDQFQFDKGDDCMKKLIALVLALVCVLGLVGCNNDNQQKQEDKEANTHTLKVTENSVGEIGRETFNLSVEITEEDANTLSEIINGSTWKEELTDCESDCVINLKGHWAHYNSESGILNKYNVKDLSVYSSKVQEVSGKSLVLSEEDRATVNTILEKYITLGIESN